MQACSLPNDDTRVAMENGVHTTQELDKIENATETEVETAAIHTQEAQDELETAKSELASATDDEIENELESEIADDREAETLAEDQEEEKRQELEDLKDSIEEARIPLCPVYEIKHKCDDTANTWTDTTDYVHARLPSGVNSDNAGYFEEGSGTHGKWDMDALISPDKDELSNSVYQVGNNVLTITAVDSHGNMNECRVNVLVVDMTPPIIDHCPANMRFATHPEGACSRRVEWPTPHATDNVEGVDLSVTHSTPNTFGLGVTNVKFTAKDKAGNEDVCAFTVTIFDEEPPIITCPEQEEHVFPRNDDKCVDYDNVVDFRDRCSATDNCGGIDQIHDITCDPQTPTAMGLGEHEVLCTVNDNSGNEAADQGKTEFSIVDEHAPAITCPDDITEDLPSDGPTVTVELEDATATDNSCKFSLKCVTENPGKDLAPGEHSVAWVSQDSAGHTSECSYLIKIEDNTAPVWEKCPTEEGDIAFNNTRSEDYTVAHWTKPTATDNSGEDVIYGGDYTTLVEGLAYPLGVTRVKYTAADAAGNEAICEFQVIVSDNEKPRFVPGDLAKKTCPADTEGVASGKICGGRQIIVGAHNKEDRANSDVSTKDYENDQTCCFTGETCKNLEGTTKVKACQ